MPTECKCENLTKIVEDSFGYAVFCPKCKRVYDIYLGSVEKFLRGIWKGQGTPTKEDISGM